MYKALVRAPLQQAMVLLWLLGAVRLTEWLVHAPPAGKWVVSAGAAAVLLLFIGARLRLLVLIPVWLALALGAVVAAAYLLGIQTASGIAVVTGVFGFLAWRTAVSLLASPAISGLAHVLDLRGGYAAPGGRVWGERYVYWTGFTLTVLALAMDIQSSASAFAVPAVSWPVLAVALVFLLLSGQRYRLELNTYLGIVLVLLGVARALAAASAPPAPGVAAALPVTDLRVGLILGIGAAFALSLALGLARRSAARSDAEPATLRFYEEPLRNAAVAMALLANLQVLILAPGLAGPGWSGVVILSVTSAVVLIANRELDQPLLTAIAGLSASWAVSWCYSALVHARPPFGLWPGGTAAGDEWLVLSLLALGLGTAGYGLYTLTRWRQVFGVPLLGVAALVYGWSLAGALSLYAEGSAHLPAIAAMLMAGLFPLLRPVPHAEELRGIGVALLLSLFAAAVLGPEGRAALGAQAWLTWAFALWLLGTLFLPHLNARLSDWSVAPRTWPWLGLIALALGLALAHDPGVIQWGVWIVTAAYFFLMLRHSAWPAFVWLGVVVLSLGVVLFGVDRYGTGLAQLEIPAIGALALQNLIWANVLLTLVVLWERYGSRVAPGLGWRQAELRPPLLYTAFALLLAWLLGILVWDAVLVITDLGVPAQRAQAVFLGAVLALSLLHGLVRWSHPVSAHALIVALFATALAAWGISQPFHLPLAVVLFGVMVAAAWTWARGREEVVTQPLKAAMQIWLMAMPLLGFALLLSIRGISLGERLVTVGLLAGVAAFSGWRWQSQLWIYAAALFAALLLHGVWLNWIPWARAGSLLPVFALQFALIAGGLRWLSLSLRERGTGDGEASPDRDFARVMLSHLIPAAALLSLAEWGAHLLVTADGLLSGLPMSRLAEPWGHATAMATPLVLAMLCILEAARSRRDRWVYATAALVVITGLYGRMLWVGLAPVSVWDTAAIIASGYLLFALQAVTGSKPLVNLTLVLPLAAIFTVPFQLGSGHAALSLFALGALYLMTRRSTGLGTPMYLALLAINGGIYLWVPDWVSRFGLFQAYIIPAALTVLLLLHLHRQELKPGVLNGARLTALCTLYAVATLDVFLQESLWVFVLALGLSLVGIVLGIVSRMRAFLYAGMAFLMINVLGQLFQLYPEQRLGRALVLMVLGAAVTAAMIGFNLKREVILQRIRVIRSDLATWD